MLHELLHWLSTNLGLVYEESAEAGKRGRYETYAIRLDIHPGEYSPALTKDGTVYIGSGVYPTRKEEHIKVARRKLATVPDGKSLMQQRKLLLSHKEKILVWAEDNAVGIVYSTLWRTDNREEAFCAEQFWINHYNLHNLANEARGHCNKYKKKELNKQKMCRICGTALSPGENIPIRRFLHRDYVCSACYTDTLPQRTPVPRQQEHQKRKTNKKRSGTCVSCSNPVLPGTVYCVKHTVSNRKRANEYYHSRQKKEKASA